VRLGRFELSTSCFGGTRSIHLSYSRTLPFIPRFQACHCACHLAPRSLSPRKPKVDEPSPELSPDYSGLPVTPTALSELPASIASPVGTAPTRAPEPVGPVLHTPVPNLYVRPIVVFQAGA
jgi:hypothetical protein